MKLFRNAKFYLAMTMLFFSALNVLRAQDYQLNTSEEVYWPAPPLEKPDYLETITDPTFGTKITRISGDVGTTVKNVNETWRNVARHGYSVRQPWNADESMIYLNQNKTYGGSWGSSLFLDGQTYQPIKKAVFQSGTNEIRWHPTKPDIMFVLTNSSVIEWNVRTDARKTLIEFPGYTNTTIGEYTGNFTPDGRKVSIMGRRTADSKNVGFVVDVVDNIKYPDIDFSGFDIDFITTSPLGNYMVVNGNFGSGIDRTQIYDIQGNKVGSLWSEYGRPSHFDVAVDQNGDEVVVGGSKSAPDDGRIISRRMRDGKVTVLTPGGYAGHASARSINRPGWVYTITSTSLSWKPYLGEIIAVKLDGSRVERICHTRNLFGVYDNQPQPVPSPSGTRVMYASDWNSGGVPIQAYVVDFRNLQSPDPPGNLNADAGEDVAVCKGNSTILTATGGTSYEWSTGETTASIEVAPNTTTVYGVTVSDDDGAMGYDEVVVSVTELPNINAGDDVTINSGASVDLTATGGQTYRWSNGQAFNTITVSPATTTTYTVTGKYGDCENTDSVTVFVDGAPPSDTDPLMVDAGEDTAVCKGESTSLTATGAHTYVWSTGETTAKISISPQSTTAYSVTGYDESGDNSDTDEIIVTVNEIPETYAGEDVTINLGETITLLAIGAQNYLWNTGANSASIDVSPNSTTTYAVTGTSNGCESTDSVKVTVINDDVENTVNADAGDDKTICQGESVTLTATGGNSYQWSTGETSASITVSPESTTTYSVTAYDESGENTDTDDVKVFVNTQPEVYAGEDVTITEGETISLLAIGANAYEWSNGATSSSIEVSPAETTTYTVTGSTNGCSDSDSVRVIVEQKENEEPGNSGNANAGPDQDVCRGNSVTLTASQGDSYLWSTGETTRSITVSPEIPTRYTVTVYINNEASQDDVMVNVNENPEVVLHNGEEISIVEGEFVTLRVSGADRYEWSNGASQPNVAVSPTETTSYWVKGFINDCFDRKTITVNVVAKVQASIMGDQEICQGSSTTLIATGGDSYLWSTGETTATIEVEPEESTEYTVTVYNELDYDEASVFVTVTDCSDLVSIGKGETAEDNSPEFKVYKGFNDDQITIKIKGYENAQNVAMLDLTGKLLFTEELGDLENSVYKREINTSILPDAVYIIQFTYRDKALVKKISLR